MSDLKFDRISADEAHSLRSANLGPGDSLVKGVPMAGVEQKANSWKDKERTATFVMSAEVQDRMGDIVVQEGLDIERFMANPQALLFHNSRSWPIGKWANVSKQLTGRPKRTEGDMVLLPEGADVDADRAARHIAAGTMKTVSIGFKVDWEAVEAIRDENKRFIGLRFLKSELLECSLVPIPALPAAMMKEADPSMLSKEHLELVEMTLDNFVKDPRTGLVVRREALEARRKELDGDKLVVTISKEAEDSLIARVSEALAAGLVRAGDPPKPKDGEEVPIAPNPGDTEKQKEEAQPERVRDPALPTDWSAGVKVIQEHARESKEPGLFARMMKALGVFAEDKRHEDEPEQKNDGTEPPKVTELSDADKTALQERVKASLEKSKSIIETTGAAG